MINSKSIRILSIVCLLAIAGVLSMAASCATQEKPAPAPSPAPTATPKPAPAPAPKPTPTPTPVATPTPKTQPIVLEMVTVLPTDREKMKIWLMTIDRINKLAAEKYPGQFSIKIRGGPEVIPAGQQPLAVKKGQVDLVSTFGTMVETMMPALNTPGLSRLTADEERKRGAVTALRKYAAEAGFYFLGLDDASKDPIFYAASRKPVAKLDDLKGLRAGGLGTIGNASAASVGMSYKPMPYAETYTAMETGVIDVYINAADTLVALGLHQIKGLVVVDHPYYIGAPLSLMNLDKWKSLPKNIQDLMEQARIEMEPETAKLMTGFYDRYVQNMKNAGVKFIKLPPEEAKRYLDLAYSSQWQELAKQQPDAIKTLMDLYNK
ncbi:MAG: TRAP transporter substrate-binding protein DctP [Chloroflexi bacterium]|nr:TRAP transporter substrate-binding protein DctP [Chloroflexota bacterium]